MLTSVGLTIALVVLVLRSPPLWPLIEGVAGLILLLGWLLILKTWKERGLHPAPGRHKPGSAETGIRAG